MMDDDLICIGYIQKSNQLISLILAKYNQNNCMQIVTHTRTSLSKLYQYGTCITSCPFYPIPKGYETNVIWLVPFVCVIEYMPSNGIEYRQAVFKGIRDDKLPEECRFS